MQSPDSAKAPAYPRRIGRYALFGPLASGGMATVHLGRLLGPVGFSRTVAIKRLHEQFAADPEFVAMFLDEARLAARVQHPNVVQTLDVVAIDNELFIVMEYVHGESLSRLVSASKSRGGIDPKLVATILAGALHGLHAAHEAKAENGAPLEIVHRDVSPQNILVGVDGVSRVLDFGVAKAANRIHATQGGTIKGKFRYMPPEQVQNRTVDRRVDIYAAGVCLFEALTGRRYIEAEEHAAMVLEIVSRQPVAPTTYRAESPTPLDPIVMKALAPDPTDRYATAQEMALALEDAVGLASPARVGKWVTEIAAAALTQRVQRVAEVESSTSGTFVEAEALPVQGPPSSGRPFRVTGPHLPPVEATSPSNVAAALNTTPDTHRVHPLWYAVAAGTVLLVMGIVTLLVVVNRGRGPEPMLGRNTSAAGPIAAPPPPPREMPISSSASEAQSNRPPDMEAPDDDAGIGPPDSATAPTRRAPVPRPHPPRPTPSAAEDLYRRRR